MRKWLCAAALALLGSGAANASITYYLNANSSKAFSPLSDYGDGFYIPFGSATAQLIKGDSFTLSAISLFTLLNYNPRSCRSGEPGCDGTHPGFFNLGSISSDTHEQVSFDFPKVYSDPLPSGISIVFSNNSDSRVALTVDGLGLLPEPSSWAMMIAGFGMIGLVRRRAPVTA